MIFLKGITKQFFSIFCICVLLGLSYTSFGQQGYQNPVLKGFNPDPSICRVGDDFYMVTSSFEYFPGLPIYHSTDLVNWKQIGHCLTRQSQLDLQNANSSGGLFAPSIRYHDGIYYIICTNVSSKGNFYCTTTDPYGEWSDPIWVDIKSIDPDIFWDDDGKSYFVTQGDEGIRITEIDINTGKVLSPERLVWAGTGGRFPEAPHVYKKDGYYYLLLGEGGTEYAHSTSIARSKSLFGPYISCPLNPILAHGNRLGQANPIQGVGHADFVQAPDSSWWAVFLGFRVSQPYSYYHNLGRETFLAPVDWPKGGWPQVNGNGTISLTMNVPTLAPQQNIPEHVSVDFDKDKLDMQWQYLRNPIVENYSLQERKGFLRMNTTTAALTDVLPISFIGRRQTQYDFETSTALELSNVNDHEEAGFTLYQNNTHHYDFFLRKRGNKYVVQVRAMVGSLKYTVAEREVPSNTIQLKILGTPLSYSFYVQSPKGQYEELAVLDTRYLSTEVAGGFTGVMIGLYATSNGKKGVGKAYFDWFKYEEK